VLVDEGDNIRGTRNEGGTGVSDGLAAASGAVTVRDTLDLEVVDRELPIAGIGVHGGVSEGASVVRRIHTCFFFVNFEYEKRGERVYLREPFHHQKGRWCSCSTRRQRQVDQPT